MTMEECRLEASRRASDEAFWAVCLADGTLIGYYEKHEYRNPETAKLFDFGDE